MLAGSLTGELAGKLFTELKARTDRGRFFFFYLERV